MEFYFDLDGTLIDVSKRHYAVYSDIAAALGFPALSFDSYWMAKRTRSDLSEILGASEAANRIKEFRTMWLSRIEHDDYLGLDNLFPCTLEVLRELRIGSSLTLVTLRHLRNGLDRQLDRLKLTALFDRVVSATVLGQPAAFKATLIQRLAPAPAAWIVGDTEADILAAKALGFISCAVTSGLRSMQILRGFGPDYIIEQIEDLLGIAKLHATVVNPAR